MTLRAEHEIEDRRQWALREAADFRHDWRGVTFDSVERLTAAVRSALEAANPLGFGQLAESDVHVIVQQLRSLVRDPYPKGEFLQ